MPDDNKLGMRDNKAKLPMELLPIDAKQAIVEVYRRGAAKYAPRNWEQGLDWMATAACIERHLDQWKAGHDYDPETGCLHSAMVAWNAIALLTFQLRGIGQDSRPYAEAAMPMAVPAKIKDTDFSYVYSPYDHGED